MKKKEDVFIIGNIITPLFIGAVMYYLFFPEVNFVRIIDQFVERRTYLNWNKGNIAFVLFRSFAFDGLWSYSLTFALYKIMNPVNKITVCMLLAVLCGLLFEIFQLIGLAEGVFDLWDLFWETSSSLLAILIINSRREQNEKN